eukprot:m.181033 g.181033  ORF g.181033 m.181033 type:complete len:943 (-) comp15510_c0_seq2:242-3070(-)
MMNLESMLHVHENLLSPAMTTRLHLIGNPKYSKLLNGEETDAKNSRLCVVGYPCAGKSSLVDSITGTPSRESQYSHTSEDMRQGKTAGIRVVNASLDTPSSVKSEEKKVAPTIVWDFGGHIEYYVSHDLLLRWCRDSVFVVMARLDGDRRTETERIKYWLKFITSCMQGRRICPSVIVACSFRDRLSISEIQDAKKWGKHLTALLGRMFRDKLKIYEQLFLLDTLKQDDIMTEFRSVLSAECERTRLAQQKGPSLCSAILQAYGTWQQVGGKAKFLTRTRTFVTQSLYMCLHSHLCSIDIHLTPESLYEDHIELLKIVLQYLHDCGEVIWLNEDDRESMDFQDLDSTSSFLVSNPQWFCNTVLGAILMPAGSGFDVPADVHGDGKLVSLEHIVTTLQAFDSTLSEGQVKIMLKMLCKLGLCYDSVKASRDDHEPRFLFPGAVRTQRPSSAYKQVDQRSAFYLGRRIELSKSSKIQQTLILSPALIPRLQQRIMEMVELDDIPILWATGMCGYVGNIEVAIESFEPHNVQHLTILVRTTEKNGADERCRQLLDQITRTAICLCGVSEELLRVMALSPTAAGEVSDPLAKFLPGKPLDELKRKSCDTVTLNGRTEAVANFIEGAFVPTSDLPVALLSTSQQQAFDTIEAHAKDASLKAEDELFLEMQTYYPSFTRENLKTILKYIAKKAELHVNIKLLRTDKDTGDLINIAESMWNDGRLKNLFETGHGGGVTKKDLRKQWEHNLFDGAYDSCEDKERPKYGNLNVLGNLAGDVFCSRYGGSYLVLKPHMRQRVTVCSGDSAWCKSRSPSPPYSNLGKEQVQIGTLDHCAHVLLDILRRRQRRHKGTPSTEETIEEHKIRTKGLVELFVAKMVHKDTTKLHLNLGLMPNYVKLQVHGDVTLAEDVDEIVVHPDDTTEETKPYLAKFGEIIRRVVTQDRHTETLH